MSGKVEERSGVVSLGGIGHGTQASEGGRGLAVVGHCQVVYILLT